MLQGGPCDIDTIVPIDLSPPILGDLPTYCGIDKPAGLGSAFIRPKAAARWSSRQWPIADLGDFYRKVWRCARPWSRS